MLQLGLYLDLIYDNRKLQVKYRTSGFKHHLFQADRLNQEVQSSVIHG